MKAKVTGVSAWQGTPTGGTLSIRMPRYVDSSGNATVEEYVGWLDVAHTPPRWMDGLDHTRELYIIVQGPDDPPGPRASFYEVLEYGAGKAVRTPFSRKLISSDLAGLIFDYAAPEPDTLPSDFGDAPLTMRAAAAAIEQQLADHTRAEQDHQQQVANNAATTSNINAMTAASGTVIAELRNADALGKLATQAAGGAVSASTTAPTFTRPSVALHPTLGTDVPADQARTTTQGGKLFAYLDRATSATAVNLFANPYAPATQLVTVVSGTTYTVTARGGTVALYGAVTASVGNGRSVTFKAAGTQLGVVVGAGVTHVQVEASPWATTRMPAAGRAREALGAIRRVGTFPR